ncbi:OmpH family outer membrane protein [Aureibacter tunicatorum]|uniref:Outer membrane protein n=1 Tax=Aureibacter tunicatorum TaxID=866807 RepID=A0AAE3XSY2_9BACT|nr:OmpH family outer membrane protein [Aureibacter tunicatorum]MDR6242017.1 outer membrane protein [Aureibacter tunicatorum]BDD07138.1 hypothetical protein AUTU_46210 [Aureibacter tunicatorum]
MKQRILIVIGIILLLSACNQADKKLLGTSSLKVGYVDNMLLLEKYRATIVEYQDLKVFKEKQVATLDSLMKLVNLEDNPVEAEMKMKNFNHQKSILMDKENEIVQMIERKAWNKINQDLKEFGDLEGYSYILGAMGNGSLMYASKTEDITMDVLEYSNKKSHE